MTLVSCKTVLLLLSLTVVLPLAKPDAPDIHTVKPDLTVPGAGVRQGGLRQAGPGDTARLRENQGLSCHLFADRLAGGKRYPVIVEYAGNNYRGAQGDISTGRPEGSNMGYGISGGRDFIWVCLPYLNAAGEDIALTWWGDAKNRTAKPTLDYCLKAVPWICEQYGGDPGQVILAGFSRGAIACNYLGLHNDRVAKLWRAFIPYSHYDGIAAWPYPGSDRDSAGARLKRLAKRPMAVHLPRGHRLPAQPRGNPALARVQWTDGKYHLCRDRLARVQSQRRLAAPAKRHT